jgi:hypothetical protein
LPEKIWTPVLLAISTVCSPAAAAGPDAKASIRVKRAIEPRRTISSPLRGLARAGNWKIDPD